jgi:hypothetical protein
MNKIETDLLKKIETMGVLTGSRAFLGKTGRHVDYDYVIHFPLYETIFDLLKKNEINGRVNYKGGFKLFFDDKTVDVWPSHNRDAFKVINAVMKTMEDEFKMLSVNGKNWYVQVYEMLQMFLEKSLVDPSSLDDEDNFFGWG